MQSYVPLFRSYAKIRHRMEFMHQGNKVFREEALERLSSPEQLDKLMRVVRPQT